MNKINIGFNLKLPIQGIQYSNIENWCTWEIETEDGLDKALSQATQDGKKIREFVAKVGSQAEVELKSKLEDLESNIEKAREEYIKLATENKDLKAKLNRK